MFNLFNPLGERPSLKQIANFILYLAFIGGSIFATGESVAMSLSKIPQGFAYFIGFLTLSAASFGLSLIKKSTNGGYVSSRYFKIIFGSFFFLFCWTISFISNTHSIYFRFSVDDIKQRELTLIRNELESIEINSVLDFELAKEEFNVEIENQISKMKYEITNEGDLGHGKKTDSIIGVISKLLQSEIDNLDSPGNDRNSLRLHAKQMTDLIKGLKDRKLQNIDARIVMLREFFDNNEYQDLKKSLEYTIENYYELDFMPVNKVLKSSFAYYNKCFTHIEELFKLPLLKKYSSLSNIEIQLVPESIELENISRSWSNISTGRSMNKSNFKLSMMWAFLIDLASFVFFYFGVLPNKED